MNHQRQYQLLVQKAQNRERETNAYYEKHHIIPRAKGGGNQKSNLVFLTGREHFVAHMLLARIYGGGMWQAAKMMKNARNGVQRRNVNSRLYEIAKREWANFLKGKERPDHVIEAIKKMAVGRKASEETKLKMSQVRKGRPRSGDPSKWKHTDAAKEKMKKSHSQRENHMKQPEHRERMKGDSNPMKSEEARKKISEAKKLYWQNKHK